MAVAHSKNTNSPLEEMKSLKESILDGSDVIVAASTKRARIANDIRHNIGPLFIDALNVGKVSRMGPKKSLPDEYVFQIEGTEGSLSSVKDMYHRLTNNIEYGLGRKFKSIDWYTYEKDDDHFLVLDGVAKYKSGDKFIISIRLYDTFDLLQVTINLKYFPDLVDEIGPVISAQDTKTDKFL